MTLKQSYVYLLVSYLANTFTNSLKMVSVYTVNTVHYTVGVFNVNLT